MLLPLTQAQEPAVLPVKKRPVQGTVALNGLLVYAIDNDQRILDGMRLLLEGWGCHVETFRGSGSFPEPGAKVDEPDLILADYHLDGEYGLDAIVMLRARFQRALPAVLITADRSQEVRDAAEALDVPVINKPLKPAVLRTMMMRARRMAPAAE